MITELPRISTGDRCLSPLAIGLNFGDEQVAQCHACKTCHKKLVGQPAKDSADYLTVEDQGEIYLNLIDPDAPLFRIELFVAFAKWAEDRYAEGDTIYIHCDEGRSRSRTLALILGARLGLLPREGFIPAAIALGKASGQPYRPSSGIRLFVAEHWAELMAEAPGVTRVKAVATTTPIDVEPTAPAATGWRPSGAKEVIDERAGNHGYTVAELDEVADDPELWARLHGHIPERVTKEAVRLVPSPLQLRMFHLYRVKQSDQSPCRMIVPKIRRGGGSTGAQCIMYCHAHNYNARLGSIGTDDEVAMNMFKMVRFFDKADTFPGWARSSKQLETGLMEWPNGSSWEKYTAERPEAARSAGLHGYHACLPGHTPVILADGLVLPIREIVEGHRVMTHSGASAVVTAITGRANRKGELVRITPWSGEGVSMTVDHKVWTKRGLIRADEVTTGDCVSLPVRPIHETGAHDLVLQPSTPRRQGGGRLRKQAGQIIPKDRETGFFFGYYLAEGHVKVTGDRVTQLTFARHRSEVAFTDRAMSAVAKFAHRVVTKDRDASLTTQVHIYGTALAQLVNDHFGRTDGKHVPDWVWSAGDEFATGLLLGYLAGDGSKSMQMDLKKSGNRITATTIHASIATQMRDLAASLGWGWASMATRPAGNYYGRNCKARYILTWNGAAAAVARELLGLPVLQKRRAGFEYRRSVIEGNQAWMQVRKIEADQSDVVYDLEVDHPDHTFRTLFFSVSNSEVGRWPDGGAKDAKETLKSMLGAVPRRGFTVVIEESTAQGATGAFYDRFQSGRWPTAGELGVTEGDEYWRKWADETPQNVAASDAERRLQFVRVFSAWFEDDENRPEMGVDPEEAGRIMATLDAKEIELIRRYRTIGPQGERIGDTARRATLIEQLAWRRSVIATEFEGDVEGFQQENPSSPKEAFASSGRHTFNRSGVAWMIETAKARTPETGVLERQVDGGVTFRRTSMADAWFLMWEAPREGMSYLTAVDTMGGKSQTKNPNDADFNASPVLRAAYVETETGLKRPHRVVASLTSLNQDDPDVLAMRADLVCDYYGGCLCVHEDNNTGAAFRQEAKRLNMNLYRRVETDKHTFEQTEYIGWQTNVETRPQLFATGKKLIRNNARAETRPDGVECWNETTAKEAADCIRHPDGKDAAPGSKHDDHLLALLIALHCIEGATYFAGKRRRRREPSDRNMWRPAGR